MASRRGSTHFWNSATVVRAAAGGCALLLVASALAQEAPSPSQTPSVPAAEPPPAAAPSPAFKPGFVHELGRWLEEGASKFKSGMQGAQETLDKLGGQARDAAKDATGAVMALPNTKAVTARERCAPAQNGAPDCQTAANTLCRGKGFQAGKILDTQTEQKCPAKLLLSGRAPNDSDCSTEIFVTRAMCQ